MSNIWQRNKLPHNYDPNRYASINVPSVNGFADSISPNGGFIKPNFNSSGALSYRYAIKLNQKSKLSVEMGD